MLVNGSERRTGGQDHRVLDTAHARSAGVGEHRDSVFRIAGGGDPGDRQLDGPGVGRVRPVHRCGDGRALEGGRVDANLVGDGLDLLVEPVGGGACSPVDRLGVVGGAGLLLPSRIERGVGGAAGARLRGTAGQGERRDEDQTDAGCNTAMRARRREGGGHEDSFSFDGRGRSAAQRAATRRASVAPGVAVDGWICAAGTTKPSSRMP